LPELLVGGIAPLTSTDYPGCLAAVIFCQGCPWRCGYCHNPHLIPRDGEERHDWPVVTDFLRRRRGLLDAVVFSGGEPTLQDALPQAIEEVRRLGFRIGLHTGGTYPARLKEILPLLDWVGMDIKADFAEYSRITATPGSGDKAQESARMLLESGIACEFRTTVHPLYHSQEGLLHLAETLRDMGVRSYALQEFRPQGCADQLLNTFPAVKLLNAPLCERIGAMFERFSLRAG
jgi:anaerobic ribonucleoside-triphosphate reductase activating protein